MTFKVNKIQHSRSRAPQGVYHLAAKVLIVTLAIFAVGGVAVALYNGVSNTPLNLSLPSIVNTLGGTDLKTDANGKTNMLLLGTGGGAHSGGGLTDTMIVASYDHSKGTLTMVSIPRDLYVKASGRSGSGSMMRINQVYNSLLGSRGKDQAMVELQEVIAKITGLEMQYYAKVDFQAFVETVDILGGIDVDVPKRLSDPLYPVETADGVFVRNETFTVEQGVQHMDGATALKYVRSRHSTSDFDRSLRQQQVIVALKDKAEQSNYLTSASKIRQLYSVISRNLETDVDLQEMVRGAYLASKLDRSKVVSVGLTSEGGKPGSVLYPPDRSLTGGASVLMPIGSTVYREDFGIIKRFVDTVTNMPEIFTEKVPIVVSNGTKRSGLAQQGRAYLTQAGFTVIETANSAEKLEKTRIIVSEEFLSSKTVEYLPLFLPAEVVTRPLDPNGETGSYVEIILGNDTTDARLNRR